MVLLCSPKIIKNFVQLLENQHYDLIYKECLLYNVNKSILTNTVLFDGLFDGIYGSGRRAASGRGCSVYYFK